MLLPFTDLNFVKISSVDNSGYAARMVNDKHICSQNVSYLLYKFLGYQ